MKRHSFLSGRRLISVWLGAANLLTSLALALPPEKQNVDDFFRDFTADWVRHDPSLATRTRYFSGEEQRQLERQLTPLTLAWQRDRIQRAKQGLADLQRFDKNRMTETQRISADLLQWQLKMVVGEESFLDYRFSLEQFRGANVNLVYLMTVVYPLATESDAENYVAALGQVGTRMEEAIAESRRLADKHILPPKFILQATIKQMQGFVASTPPQNPLVTILDQKMTSASGLSESKRKELRAEAEKIVGSLVYPAWKEAIALLESQLAASTDDAGLWRLKNGGAAYSYYLERYTTTSLTAEQIHKIGLKHVALLEKQIDAQLRRLGRTEGSVNDRLAKLRRDLSYPNPSSEESRTKIMEEIRQILSDAQKRSTQLFDEQPKAPVIAQAFPKFQEANAAASYTAPTRDGSRPGTFQYPLRPDQMTKFRLRNLIYHETVPGHHFQIALEMENGALPRFRQFDVFPPISALNEGWALYAERLTAESGWYNDDPEGLIGQLASELFRARRLVVDTGLHAKHWTRQEAIDYGIEPSEVDRYVVLPGQACSYMIGELKIIELRDRAKKALGDQFSLPKFHDVVLETGTVPLDILERQVDAYIRSRNGKP